VTDPEILAELPAAAAEAAAEASAVPGPDVGTPALFVDALALLAEDRRHPFEEAFRLVPGLREQLASLSLEVPPSATVNVAQYAGGHDTPRSAAAFCATRMLPSAGLCSRSSAAAFLSAALWAALACCSAAAQVT
jgi:hypothetical protein